MSRKTKLYGAIAGVFVLAIAGFGIVRALTSVDSNIATVTTRGVGTSPPPYIGQCVTKDTSTIAVSWTRSDTTSPATALLYGSDTLDGVRAAMSPLAQAPVPGSYDDSNLAPGTQRWYRVDTLPVESNAITGSPFTCTTNWIASDVPTKLGIFANGPDTMFFNWKDNATSTGFYDFEVQRIRITPETPSSTATSSPVLANQAAFKWAVEGTSTPYQTVIERSTSTDGMLRFSKDPTKDPSFRSFPTGQWNNPLSTKKYESFTYTDYSVEDATVYHYRFKTCSLIQIGDLYTKEITGVEELNGVETKPSPACSAYRPLDSVITIMTPPAPPSDFVATAFSASVIDLSWVNHSVNADGYEIQRSKDNTQNYTTLVTANKTATSYRDSSLDTGTRYYYRIRSYKDFGGGVKLYSTPTAEWIFANAYTWFTVNASVSSDNGGQGSVRSSPSGISCSSSCSASFPWGTSVTMSATPASPNSVFDGWSGDCSGTSCLVGANANVTARFTNLCANVTCYNGCVGSTYYAGGSCSAGTCSYITKEETSSRCEVLPPVSCATNADCIPYCGGTNGFTYSSNGSCTAGTCSYASPAPDSPLCGFVAVQSPGSSNVALQTETVHTVQEAKISFPRIALTATIADAMKSVGSAIWGSLRLAWDTVEDGVNQLASFFESQVPVAEGQSTSIDYDAYFAQATSPTPLPSKKDIGLRSETVYLYRVRVNYGAGKTSAWSAMIAGKTLGGNEVKLQGVAGACINNSYCEQRVIEVPNYQHRYVDPNNPTRTLTEHSELQCRTNADCRNVGRSSQTFEER